MGERFLFMISLVFTSKAFLWIGYSVGPGFSNDVNQLVNQQTEISSPRKKHVLLLNSDHFLGLLSHCFHCCTQKNRTGTAVRRLPWTQKQGETKAYSSEEVACNATDLAEPFQRGGKNGRWIFKPPEIQTRRQRVDRCKASFVMLAINQNLVSLGVTSIRTWREVVQVGMQICEATEDLQSSG